jgi:hypothetical protein
MLMGWLEVDSEKKEKSTVTGEFGPELCACAAISGPSTKPSRDAQLTDLNVPSCRLVVPAAILFEIDSKISNFTSHLLASVENS